MSEFILIPSSRSLRTPFHIPKKYETYQLDRNNRGSIGVIGFFLSPDGRTPIAVKKFIDPYATEGRIRLINRELDLLKKIRHSNIVSFIESYEVEGSIYHITEYCGPELFTVINEGLYTVEHVKKWTMELLRALRHLHENDIIHRNLNPSVMCIHQTSNQLTLIGFGDARVQDHAHNNTMSRGDLPYTAIEMQIKFNDPYDEKVDIWSMTAILCEMLSGSILFYNERNSLKAVAEMCGTMDDSMLAKITNPLDREGISHFLGRSTRKNFIEHLKENIRSPKGDSRDTRPICHLELNDETNLRDFIERTLRWDPDQRMSADEALAHPFLKVDKRKSRALEDKYMTAANPKEQIMAKLSYAPVDEQQIKRTQVNQEQLPEFKSKFAAEFTTKRVIGVGGFGVVFEVEDIRNKRIYAVKRITMQSRDEDKALRETQAMTELNECDRIVLMHETWTEKPPEGWQYNVDIATLKTVEQNKFVTKMRETMTHRETFLYIRMELCKFSLRDWIDENTTLESRNLPRMKTWFHQVVSAVAFLHHKNFIHRDLKPCNILFLEDDKLKLCDLGIVTLRSKGGGPTAIYRTSIGTLLYMSPEQRATFSMYGSKTDVFSLGLILAELSIVMTSDERNKIFDNYRSGIQSDRVTDNETKEFVGMLTLMKPEERPTCQEMLGHKFFS